MKKQSLIPLFGAALLVTGVACQRTDTKSTVEFEKFNAVQTFRLDGSASVVGSAEDIGFRCTANMLMPVAVEAHDISSLRDSILQSAFDSSGVNTAAVAYSSMKRLAVECSGFQAVDTVLPDSVCEGLYDVEGVVSYMSDRVMSYVVTVSTYAPRAAHGMSNVYYTNYDMSKGRVFGLSDLVTAEGLATLPATLRQIAESMRGSIGETAVEGLPSDGNFYINNGGEIVFVYQPYEVASYSQGVIELPVPAYLISNDLTPYGKEILL